MDFERETLALLKEHGAVLERSKKHRVYRFPDGKIFVMGSTWSDRFSEENNYRDLLKLLNIRREVIKNPERRRKPGIKHRDAHRFIEARGKSFREKLQEALS